MDETPKDICGCGHCSATVTHASECAVHNGPAFKAGSCDCQIGQQESVMDDMTMFERLTKEIGDNLYGHVDPVDTPNTWGISEAIALCALKVIYAHVPPSDSGLLPGQLENAITEGEKLEGVRWRD